MDASTTIGIALAALAFPAAFLIAYFLQGVEFEKRYNADHRAFNEMGLALLATLNDSSATQCSRLVALGDYVRAERIRDGICSWTGFGACVRLFKALIRIQVSLFSVLLIISAVFLSLAGQLEAGGGDKAAMTVLRLLTTAVLLVFVFEVGVMMRATNLWGRRTDPPQ